MPTFWVPRQSPSIDQSIPCSTQIPSLQGSFQSNSGCLNFWKVKVEGEVNFCQNKTHVFFFSNWGAPQNELNNLRFWKNKMFDKIDVFFLFSWSVSIGFLRFLWFYLSGWQLIGIVYWYCMENGKSYEMLIMPLRFLKCIHARNHVYIHEMLYIFR